MPGITGEHDLIVQLGEQQAGGVQGQLIIEDISLSGEKDVNEYAGVGNDTTQGTVDGNQTFTVSFTKHLNGAAADLFLQHYDEEGAVPATIRGEHVEFIIDTLEWSSFDYEASDDDGSVTIAMDNVAVGVKPERV